MNLRFRNSPIKMNSCRTDFCSAKFGHLKVELEEAQGMMMMIIDNDIDENDAGDHHDSDAVHDDEDEDNPIQSNPTQPRLRSNNWSVN